MANPEDAYSVSQGEDYINWWELLDKLEHNFDDGLWVYAQIKSESWVTCACGNQCASIPRGVRAFNKNEPDDLFLTYCGFDFHKAIKNKDWKDARIKLIKIEERSAEILKEM